MDREGMCLVLGDGFLLVLKMHPQSVNFAGLMIFCGAVLAGICWRNIFTPPPHYENVEFAKWSMWIGLFSGLLILVSGVVLAFHDWQAMVHRP
jgi:hypothetical protein